MASVSDRCRHDCYLCCHTAEQRCCSALLPRGEVACSTLTVRASRHLIGWVPPSPAAPAVLAADTKQTALWHDTLTAAAHTPIITTLNWSVAFWRSALSLWIRHYGAGCDWLILAGHDTNIFVRLFLPKNQKTSTNELCYASFTEPLVIQHRLVLHSFLLDNCKLRIVFSLKYLFEVCQSWKIISFSKPVCHAKIRHILTFNTRGCSGRPLYSQLGH